MGFVQSCDLTSTILLSCAAAATDPKEVTAAVVCCIACLGAVRQGNGGFREVNFGSLNFFLFRVLRNSVDFGSLRDRKSLAGPRFGTCSDPIFAGFRIKGVAKSSPGRSVIHRVVAGRLRENLMS